MAPRANWKGFLKVAEVTCPVALYTAASTSERIAFHTLNRQTGNRVHRAFVDSENGAPVEREDQVKGFDIGGGEHIILEPEEVADAVPESDKTLSISAFIPCGEIDDVYLDRPYYLAPADARDDEAYALIRDGLRARKVAALARTVLFRRVRTLMIRAHSDGLIATTLNFDYEVRPAAEAFADIPELKIEGEMLDLARHIIETKAGSFDPSAFTDRYESALAELVKAKIEGRKIKPAPRPKAAPTSDLLTALRQSAGVGNGKGERRSSAAGARHGRGSGGASRSAPKTAAGAQRRKAR